MNNDDKTCDYCEALQGDSCKLGYKLEPLYFSICYRTDGYKPETDCPGPFKKGGENIFRRPE